MGDTHPLTDPQGPHGRGHQTQTQAQAQAQIQGVGRKGSRASAPGGTGAEARLWKVPAPGGMCVGTWLWGWIERVGAWVGRSVRWVGSAVPGLAAGGPGRFVPVGSGLEAMGPRHVCAVFRHRRARPPGTVRPQAPPASEHRTHAPSAPGRPRPPGPTHRTHRRPRGAPRRTRPRPRHAGRTAGRHGWQARRAVHRRAPHRTFRAPAVGPTAVGRRSCRRPTAETCHAAASNPVPFASFFSSSSACFSI